jgi:predicted nucleotidyltransferase
MEAAIAPEAMARYRRTAQARELARRHETEGRRQAAWSVARQAARVLREAFGATRVIAFGSLAHGAWFGPCSDIDLAVEGVPADVFWRAWVALDRVDPAFEIDLVAIESAPDRLRDEIASQGVAL